MELERRSEDQQGERALSRKLKRAEQQQWWRKLQRRQQRRERRQQSRGQWLVCKAQLLA